MVSPLAPPTKQGPASPGAHPNLPSSPFAPFPDSSLAREGRKGRGGSDAHRDLLASRLGEPKSILEPRERSPGEGFGCAPGLACHPVWRAQVHGGAQKSSRREAPGGGHRKFLASRKFGEKKQKFWLFSQKQANHSRHSEKMRLHRPFFPTVSHNSHFL